MPQVQEAQKLRKPISKAYNLNCYVVVQGV